MSEPIISDVARDSNAPQSGASAGECGDVDSIVQELIRLRGAILGLESEAGGASMEFRAIDVPVPGICCTT